MKIDTCCLNDAFLFPPGEGRDEGIKIRQFTRSDPLTPALSRREREFVGQ